MSRDSLEQLSSKILVKEIMTKVLISVSPSTTCYQIAKMMEQAGIGAIFVKENDSPVGIITDRDFATKIVAQDKALDTPVANVMSSPLITINTDDSIQTAAEIMCSKKIRKLAVIENEKIVGVITSTDLVNQLAKAKS